MPADLAQMLATLGEAQQRLLMELDALVDGAEASLARLQRLRTSITGLAEQADSLMALMLEQGADDSLLDLGEALVEFAQNAEAKVSAMLRTCEG